jgi:hypothetical protein
MSEAEILEVVRTSTTWSEVDDRLADWHAAERWWADQPWPGLYRLSTLVNATPAYKLAQYRKYGPGGLFAG